MNIRTIPFATEQLEPYCIVEYEQHGNPILAVALERKKEKWGILNQFGAELELPENRLYLLPEKINEEKQSRVDLEKFLTATKDAAEKLKQELNLEDAWNIFNEAKDEVSIVDVVELLAVKNSLINHLTIRRLLITDKVFFKRLKDTFQPRPATVVSELKYQVKLEEERKKQQEILVQALINKLKSPDVLLPENISLLEDYAAIGHSLLNYKEADAIIDLVIDKAKLKINKNSPDKAFRLLVQVGHFSEDQNLNLIRLGRRKNFKVSVLNEVQKILLSKVSEEEIREFKIVSAITIDSEETKDFDDALSLEVTPEGYTLGIHISDVAFFIKSGSKLQEESSFRASTIYCTDETIPMLPRELSENKLSLIQGEKRLTCSFVLKLDKEFQITNREICFSEIVVKRRLSYKQVDAILEGSEKDEELLPLLTYLKQISLSLEARRLSKGALQLPRLDKQAKLDSSGKITVVIDNEDTPSHKIVAEMMIIANETAALFGRDNQIPLIYRSQDKPDVDINQHVATLPAGPAQEYSKRGLLKRSKTNTIAAIHSGLGLDGYLQVTSPIRRYMDLINQQQLASFIQEKKFKYSEEELQELIKNIEGTLDEVSFLQRERNRYFLLRYLQQEKIKELKGVVVRVDGPKPLVFIDLLGILNPFYPDNQKDKEALKLKIGVEINLNIELLDPRNEKLILREVL